MKKGLLIISLLTLFFIGGYPYPHQLIQLTIVNKSGLPLEIGLTGTFEEKFYYLRIPKGDRLFPMEKTFTIVPDEYAIQPYYTELWDPVYGYKCSNQSSQTMELIRNIRMVFLGCNRPPVNRGEPSMLKFGGAGGRPR